MLCFCFKLDICLNKVKNQAIDYMVALSQSTIEKLQYYVYLLCDPRNNSSPFYVGKGHGNRINEHLLDALKIDKNEKAKIKLIKETEAAGLTVGLVILRHGLTEKEALEIESAIIDFIGKENLTNLVKGHNATERGIMTLKEIKIKYEAEDAVFDEPAILININKKYKQNMSPIELYDVTRKCWKIDLNRVRRNKIRIACSVYRGIIREVFIVEHWFKSEELEDRKEFKGTIAEEKTRTKYIDKSVEQYWKKGSQFPTKYVEFKGGLLKP